MDKTKAQEKAIKEKYKDGSINKEKHERYDTEGGKEHKESDGYRMKKGKGEGKDKMSSDGDKKIGKCKHCGK